MQLNSFTSNKPTLHQPFLGRGGYSQRNFAMMMMVTRNNCWPVQPSSSETPQRQCRRSATAYGKPHVLVQCCPIEVVAGGLIVSGLCGGSCPPCPAGVCGATNGWCQGGYWCQLHGSHTEGVP